MALLQLLLSTVVIGTVCAAFEGAFSSLPVLYSSTFVEPIPPLINPEFRANYMQHKYDVNVNHIISGFMYFSPSNRKIRADATGDGVLEASIFDFTNTTSNGDVSNRLLSFEGGVTASTCFSDFVPAFVQLFTPDILRTSQSVYLGIQHDDLYGPVSAWQFMFTGIPITMFLDTNNTLVRYDFSQPGPLRTYATTRFFNIIPGPIDATVFETPCR